MTTNGDEPYEFDWSGLVPRVVHPIKVAVIEAMSCLNRPLSPTELSKSFGGRWSLSLVSYHVEKLEEVEVIEKSTTAGRVAASSTSISSRSCSDGQRRTSGKIRNTLTALIA